MTALRLLALALGLALAARTAARSLLIFGDSIDRFAVQDWCQQERLRGAAPSELAWGGTVLTYSGHGKLPALMCNSTSDSVAFVHMYGSKPHGPYLHNNTNSVNDSFVDTVARTQRAYELYRSSFGHPHRVMLHFAVWDVHAWMVEDRAAILRGAKVDDDVLWPQRLQIFRDNMQERIKQARGLTQGRANLGLRTGLECLYHQPSGAVAFGEFNKIIRELARSNAISLYDLDADVWSTMGGDRKFEWHLLRDALHPAPHYSAMAAAKMVGQQFSNFLQLQPPLAAAEQLREFFPQTYPPPRADRFLLLVGEIDDEDKKAAVFNVDSLPRLGETPLYLRNSSTGTLHPYPWMNGANTFLSVTGLGIGDMYPVRRRDMRRMLIAWTAPVLSDSSCRVISTAPLGNDSFVIQAPAVRRIDSAALLGEVLKIVDQSAPCQMRPEWLHFLPMNLTSVSPRLTNRNHTAYRHIHSRDIFYIEDNLRYRVGGMNEFVALELKMEDVIVLESLLDLMLFTPGE